MTVVFVILDLALLSPLKRGSLFGRRQEMSKETGPSQYWDHLDYKVVADSLCLQIS